MLMLFNKRSAILNALAFVTLIKYGVWAVIMNILMFVEQGEVTINGIMLIVSTVLWPLKLSILSTL